MQGKKVTKTLIPASRELNEQNGVDIFGGRIMCAFVS